MTFTSEEDVKTSNHLKHGPLRDFGPRVESESKSSKRYRLNFQEFPVPRLLAYSLRLLGLETGGPAEKVEWWASFSYRGTNATIAHAKFGLYLHLPAELRDVESTQMQSEIRDKLRSAVRTVERSLQSKAPELLGKGNATVVNQHHSLDRAYKYFRSRALDPTLIEDEYKAFERDELTQGIASFSTFQNGETMMRLNAFHDLIAAITAYLSRLEHDLVLALAFADFDPVTDNLTTFIGWRWGEKFNRILGGTEEYQHHHRDLTAVIERWRNAYSHGGFEKGHAATIYLHTPGVGAIPVGLTKVRESPLFSFIPATEYTIQEVFRLFDDLDAWMRAQLPESIAWIESGIDVRFDPEFRAELDRARQNNQFDALLDYFEHRWETAADMDH